MKRIFSILLIAVFVFTACGTSDRKTTTTKTTRVESHGKVSFNECDGFECATISVPMDYGDKDGRKIDIALAKLSAAKPAERIGVLLVNPGGPGASGIDFVKSSAGYVFGSEIRDRFDIVGWDPRGVGESEHVDCAKSLDSLFDGVDYSPDTDEELDVLESRNAEFVEECKQADKELLPYLSTENSVRDMDEIRKQLGEKQVNYLGFSYGTSLGQLYASMYPKNFRAMVIDGAVDLGAEPKTVIREQSIGFDNALDGFFENCVSINCGYAKRGNPRDAFYAIMESIEESPLGTGALTLGPAQFDLGVAYFLYSGKAGWASLDFALQGVLDENPAPLLNAFSSYVGRQANGEYDGTYESFLQIGCADGSIGDVDEYISMAQDIGQVAPVFGESGIYLGIACATWPTTARAQSIDVDATGSAPIIVIGSTGDPATPVQWARNVAKQLKTGVYVERVGEGHTAYGQGNACIDEIVDQYLLDPQTPETTVCN